MERARITILTAVLVGVCTCSGALATTIQHTIPVAETTITPLNDQSGLLNVWAAVPEFSPSLGSLQSVRLDLEGDFRGSMGVENTDEARSTSFTLQLSWLLSLDRPDLSQLVGVGASRTRAGLLDPFDGEVDYGGPSGASYNVTYNDVLNHLVSSAPSDLALFTGAGTLNLPLVSSYAVSVSAPQSTAYVARATDVRFAGVVTVTYDYIAPEPLSLSLLVLTGLALRRR